MVKCIPRYFILFDVIVNGIAFFFSLSYSLLLVCKNTTDFCVLILYPAILLNSFISCNSFLIESLVFSIYDSMSSADSDSFISSFPIWMSFFFSYLIALARTSNTMLNKSSKSGHHCLVPVLKGKAFTFSLLSMMLAVGLSYMVFIMLRYVPTLLKFLS